MMKMNSHGVNLHFGYVFQTLENLFIFFIIFHKYILIYKIYIKYILIYIYTYTSAGNVTFNLLMCIIAFMINFLISLL